MSSKNIALGGILTALTLVLLYLTLFIPTNTLTLLTLASFMVPVALMRGNLKTAVLVYICSSLLGFIFVPSYAVLYVIFFGCYGIVKYFIERQDHFVLEWFLKLLFYNVIVIVFFKTFIALFDPEFINRIVNFGEQLLPQVPYIGIILLWLVSQVVFIVFDYALTLLVDLYYKYFGKL
ncbi:MAG: hypothetical protein ACRCW2_03685 [Cellulosilyticaceae bacterium]